MRRILFILIALAVAAFAGWYYWEFSQRLSSAPVAALLPRETIFVAQIPDFNRARDEWQRCDIYQLYRERDRKSTRLNSSHLGISYAVFCLKKKKKTSNSHIHHVQTHRHRDAL